MGEVADLSGVTLLVANRAEIARRVIRGARELGVRTVAVYEPQDASLPHVAEADAAVELTGGTAPSPYMDITLLLDAARSTGATAVHPGYGFLSERADFARAVHDAGLTWVGPSADAIDAMADKASAKRLMRAAGVPTLPGSDGPVVDVDHALAVSAEIGYPVMVKATAGGGGRGMEIVHDADSLADAFQRAQQWAVRLFDNPAMIVERYVSRARHIEVQVLGVATGQVVALGERECSVQRRNQKVVEEAPSPFVEPELRRRMLTAAVAAAAAIDYRNAGTVEFIVDADRGEFYFLEMNTRLQVEHPVTEETTGIDLVREQLLAAHGCAPGFDPGAVRLDGHAFELRIYAEDPVRFLPSPGPITAWHEPSGPGIRVDAGYTAGTVVSRSYDPLMAKLVVHAATRDLALDVARSALADFTVEGPRSNIPFLVRLLDEPDFVSGRYDTSLVDSMAASPV